MQEMLSFDNREGNRDSSSNENEVQENNFDRILEDTNATSGSLREDDSLVKKSSNGHKGRNDKNAPQMDDGKLYEKVEEEMQEMFSFDNCEGDRDSSSN